MARLGKRVALIAALILVLNPILLQSAPALTFQSAEKKNTYAYQFTAKTLKGAKFNGQVLAGKPAVIWFWAPWCVVCRGEAPNLVALSKSFKGKINVIGVAGLGQVKDMNQFVADTKTGGFLHLADTSGAVWSRFGIVSQPSFIFITATGDMYQQFGALSKADLYAFTKEIIKKA